MFARLLVLCFVLCACVSAHADSGVTIVSSGSSAQADAEHMARTGVLRHLGRNGGRREGIGFSTSSPSAAMRACCYYGRYPIVDSGVAYSPSRRGWFACIRYGN